MAEAQSSDVLSQHNNLFFCHKCSAHIVPRLPEYECPRCDNGFIEPSSDMGNSTSETNIPRQSGSSQDAIDVDSDDAMDDSDSDRDMIFSILHGSPGGGDSVLWGGVGDAATAGGSSSGEATGSGSGRRGGSRHRINTLLMGVPNRRSRLRGPDRHQVLAPMLQDLIVHISGVPAFGLSALEELAGNPGDYVWGRGGLDAVITHFMGQLENNGPAPLTADQIAAIPSTQVTQEQCQNKMQCSVCMEDFVLSESVKKLRCDHFFHEPCITPWLKMHATCPVCRTALGDAPPDGSAAAGNQLRLGLGGRSRVLLRHPNPFINLAGTSSSSNERGNSSSAGAEEEAGSSSNDPSSRFRDDDELD